MFNNRSDVSQKFREEIHVSIALILVLSAGIRISVFELTPEQK